MAYMFYTQIPNSRSICRHIIENNNNNNNNNWRTVAQHDENEDEDDGDNGPSYIYKKKK